MQMPYTEGRNFSRKYFPFQLRITTATDGNEFNYSLFNKVQT